MKCPYCGQEHSDTIEVCPNSSRRLKKACNNSSCSYYGKAFLPMNRETCPCCGGTDFMFDIKDIVEPIILQLNTYQDIHIPQSLLQETKELVIVFVFDKIREGLYSNSHPNYESITYSGVHSCDYVQGYDSRMKYYIRQLSFLIELNYGPATIEYLRLVCTFCHDLGTFGELSNNSTCQKCFNNISCFSFWGHEEYIGEFDFIQKRTKILISTNKVRSILSGLK